MTKDSSDFDGVKRSIRFLREVVTRTGPTVNGYPGNSTTDELGTRVSSVVPSY